MEVAAKHLDCIICFLVVEHQQGLKQASLKLRKSTTAAASESVKLKVPKSTETEAFALAKSQ